MNTYQNLCTQYYDLDKPNAPANELEFYLKYAENSNGPIFEPMCGTGRFIIPMLERRLDIEGSDASSHMLSICEEKCRAKGLKPKLHQQFLHQMNFNKKFGLIFIPTGSFGLLCDVAEAKRCLKIFKDHLLPNGKLVFEVEPIRVIPAELDSHQQFSVQTKQGEKIRLDTVSSYDKKNQIVETICRYDLILNEKIIKTEIENLRVRYYQDGEIDEWLTETGFNHKRVDFNDEVMVYECQCSE